MKKTVWIVGDGEYADYQIRAIFDGEAEAQKFAQWLRDAPRHSMNYGSRPNFDQILVNGVYVHSHPLWSRMP